MKKILFTFFCAACLALVLTLNAFAAKTGKVLIVHSYHQESEWVETMSKATKKALENSGIIYEFVYMDTFRKNSEEQMQSAGQKAIQKVSEFKPDVILTFDDNAQAYFASKYAGASKPQIIFAAVNADPSKYGYPAKNVTGILETLHIEENFNFLKEIQPNTKGVGFISDVSSTTDGIYDSIRKIGYPGLNMKYEKASTFAQWKEQIKKLDRDPEVDAICIVVNKSVKSDNGGGRMNPVEISEWTINNTKKIVFGFWESKVQEGAVFSIAVSGDEHGSYPVSIAKEIIFRGKQAGDFPIIKNRNGRVCLNLNSAEKMEIELPYITIDTADLIIN